MLDYTKSVFIQTKEDLKKLGFLCSACLQSFQIIYLIYALCIGSGILFANIALLVLSVGYFSFMLYINRYETKKEIRQIFKTVYRWGKRLIKLFTLGVSVYGLFITASEPITVSGVVSIILLVFMLLGWVLDILLEVLTKVVEKRGKLFLDALKMDMEPALKAVNLIQKFRGKEVHEEIVSADARETLTHLKETHVGAEPLTKKELKALKKAELKALKEAKKAVKKQKTED